MNFNVENGSRVQAIVLSREEAERFNRGKSIRPLLMSGFEKSDQFRVFVPDAGDYVLVLDNRIEARFPAEVSLRVELNAPHDTPGENRSSGAQAGNHRAQSAVLRRGGCVSRRLSSYALEELSGGIHGMPHIFVRVGIRDEARLELRRRQIDPVLQHVVKEALELVRVRLFRPVPISYGLSVKKNVNIDPTRLTVTPSNGSGTERGRSFFYHFIYLRIILQVT